MKCPSCSANLNPLKCGDVEVDACTSGCGGVWFDEKELHKFDEAHEFSNSPIVTLAKEKQKVRVDHNKLKPCPKCEGEVLVRQFFDVKHEIEIDQCWNCSGIWLDVGELNTVRGQYKTYEDRAKAVNTYIDGHIQDVTSKMKVRTQAQVTHYQAVTGNRFRAGLYAMKILLGIDKPLV